MKYISKLLFIALILVNCNNNKNNLIVNNEKSYIKILSVKSYNDFLANKNKYKNIFNLIIDVDNNLELKKELLDDNSNLNFDYYAIKSKKLILKDTFNNEKLRDIYLVADTMYINNNFLSGFKNLKSITIASKHIINIDSIVMPLSITQIELVSPVEKNIPSSINNLHNLENLNIFYDSLSIIDINKLNNLNKLKVLNIKYTKLAQKLDSISINNLFEIKKILPNKCNLITE